MWGRRTVGGAALASALVLTVSSGAWGVTPKPGFWGGQVKHSAYNNSVSMVVKSGKIKVLTADFSSAEVATCAYGQENGTVLLRHVALKHGSFSVNAKLAQTNY